MIRPIRACFAWLEEQDLELACLLDMVIKQVVKLGWLNSKLTPDSRKQHDMSILPLLKEFDKVFDWWEVRRTVQTINTINKTLPDSAGFGPGLLHTDYCKHIYCPYCPDDRSDIGDQCSLSRPVTKARKSGGLRRVGCCSSSSRNILCRPA